MIEINGKGISLSKLKAIVECWLLGQRWTVLHQWLKALDISCRHTHTTPIPDSTPASTDQSVERAKSDLSALQYFKSAIRNEQRKKEI